MRRGFLILAAGALQTGTLLGAYGFEEGLALQRSHPEFFIPGHVSVVTNAETAYYVFSGKALRVFHDQKKTGASTLRDRASLMAHAALRSYLTPPPTKAAIEVSGALQIGKKLDANWAVYVFAAPKELVRVIQHPRPEVQKPRPLPTPRTVIKSEIKQATPQAAKSDAVDVILDLIDRVENEPGNLDVQAQLATAYMAYGSTNEACATAKAVYPLLMKNVTPFSKSAYADALLSVSAILKNAGECKMAYRGFEAVLKSQREDLASEALKRKSELLLK